MYRALGHFVSRYWWLVLIGWVALVVGLKRVAPEWDKITFDGDLAYLPATVPSVVGEKLLANAFPQNRAKSQIVFVVADSNAKDATKGDTKPAAGEKTKPAAAEPQSLTKCRTISQFITQRAQYHLGSSSIVRAEQFATDLDAARENKDAPALERATTERTSALNTAVAALTEVIRLDEGFAPAYHNRSLAYEQLGQTQEAETDRADALKLDPKLADRAGQLADEEAGQWPLLDVWNRDTEIAGKKLIAADRQAELVMLFLSNEFMATDNIRVMELVDQELKAAREFAAEQKLDDIEVGVTGSAAVGGDMLGSAKESIDNTEVLTVILVTLILAVVYRSPLLVAVPLATIVVSLIVATSLVAALTQLHLVPGFEWWNFKVFKTTRIFIVVILYGCGTDFCLFLISRYREELAQGFNRADALSRALSSVGEALVGSAFTVICGLSMMFFADFGKFRNSGPAIGLCITVTLLAALTFAPALLRFLGPVVFWPFGRSLERAIAARKTPGAAAVQASWFERFWGFAADVIMARPATILTVSFLVCLPLAYAGTKTAGHVTYDFLSELDPGRPSREGSDLLREHFAVGESGPLTILIKKPEGGFGSKTEKPSREAIAALDKLTAAMWGVTDEAGKPFVAGVRSLAEPLGDKPWSLTNPGKRMPTSVVARRGGTQNHARTKTMYLAQGEGYQGDVTKVDLILDFDPFSIESIGALNAIETKLRDLQAEPNSYWANADFVFAGTTAGIRDLREVTVGDNTRIQILVVLAVFAVILVILRRPITCLYLVATVLFSYYVAIGATEIFFQWAYGETFHGLDWKVPLFLFVILVAIGEDYNIYLATRVFEEQAARGPWAGLREAILRTGGIITSCGLIMAGSFVAMCFGTLRGMIELGFALTLGVILDTFYVRPVLVPAFLALLERWRQRRQGPDALSVPAPHVREGNVLERAPQKTEV